MYGIIDSVIRRFAVLNVMNQIHVKQDVIGMQMNVNISNWQIIRKVGLKIMSEKVLKSCEICGESFMGEDWEKTCFKHKFKPMYSSKEESNEFVYG